ncbi:MAG TPA: PsbP-related protein [Nitrososphaeraceae archaeon]|nr:PsbP-related protein [Nitrososphaeraceae archaeon]
MSTIRLSFFITITTVLLSLIGNIALSTFQQQKALAQSTVKSTDMSSNANTTTANKFLVYTNPNQGIRIDYPANWKLDEHPYADKFVAYLTSTLKNSSDVSPATFTVSVETLKKNISLDNYTNANLAKAKQSLPRFQLVESNATTLAGIPAHKIVYTFLSPDPAIQIPFTSMNIWTIKQGKAYNISYTQARSQFAKYLEVTEHMINSFTIIK